MACHEAYATPPLFNRAQRFNTKHGTSSGWSRAPFPASTAGIEASRARNSPPDLDVALLRLALTSFHHTQSWRTLD